MSFLMIYAVAAVYAAFIMIGLQAWDMRHGEDPDPVTLQNLFVAILICGVPIINILASVGLTVYFFSVVAPKIVLFGGKNAKQ